MTPISDEKTGCKSNHVFPVGCSFLWLMLTLCMPLSEKQRIYYILEVRKENSCKTDVSSYPEYKLLIYSLEWQFGLNHWIKFKHALFFLLAISCLDTTIRNTDLAFTWVRVCHHQTNIKQYSLLFQHCFIIHHFLWLNGAKCSTVLRR